MAAHQLMPFKEVFGRKQKMPRHILIILDGWIDYSHNHTLVKLFSLALNSTERVIKKQMKFYKRY